MPDWIENIDPSTNELIAWSLTVGAVQITIQKRIHYCDRGHWWAHCWDLKTLEGFESLDDADGWPRYYMDVNRAKAELSAWLDWRLRSEGVCWL